MRTPISIIFESVDQGIFAFMWNRVQSWARFGERNRTNERLNCHAFRGERATFPIAPPGKLGKNERSKRIFQIEGAPTVTVGIGVTEFSDQIDCLQQTILVNPFVKVYLHKMLRKGDSYMN